MSARITVAVTLLLALGGCSLFRGSPVPPPPPPPEVDQPGADAEAAVARLERNEADEVTGFGPLTAARQAVRAAKTDDAVQRHAGDTLQRAKQALAEAESRWQALGDRPSRQSAELVVVAHHSHLARRWAQIARAEAARAAGRERVEEIELAIARREAEDERWLGTQLVPDMYGRITFAVGTSRVAAASREVIARLVEFLQVHPRYALEVRGHTDNTPPSAGSLKRFLNENPEVAERAGAPEARAAAYNKAVSLRRARAVVDALANAGIDRDRLSAKGLGAESPIAANVTAAGRRQNRRVEVYVVPGLGWAGQ